MLPPLSGEPRSLTLGEYIALGVGPMAANKKEAFLEAQDRYKAISDRADAARRRASEALVRVRQVEAKLAKLRTKVTRVLDSPVVAKPVMAVGSTLPVSPFLIVATLGVGGPVMVKPIYGADGLEAALTELSGVEDISVEIVGVGWGKLLKS